MKIANADASFQHFLQTRGISMTRPSPASVFPAVLDFWRSVRAEDARPFHEDGDGLLFQWGLRPALPGFSEAGFYVDLTRQFIALGDEDDEDDDAIVQLRCEFEFDPDAVRPTVAGGNRWCWSTSEADDFAAFVLGHASLQATAALSPRKWTLDLDRV